MCRERKGTLFRALLWLRYLRQLAGQDSKIAIEIETLPPCFIFSNAEMADDLVHVARERP